MEFRSTKSAAGRSDAALPESSMLRAFSLLELVAHSESPATLETLTRASGLPKPTVYRILALLIRGGLLQREALEKRYAVGPRTAELALAVQMRSPARAERHAILARLVEEIGETCNFTMPDGDEVVYLDRVETTANVRLHMAIGSRVPMHCTASGKLFLAHLPAARARRILGGGPLKRFTERTITNVATLERELRKVLAAGVGTDAGEFLDGSVCLAVPVNDPHGRLCASVAVHGPAPRMTLKKGYKFLPAMRRAAGEIAATLATPH